MALFGLPAWDEDGNLYYEYPEVNLTLNKIAQLPEKIYCGNCYTQKTHNFKKLDPNIVYLAWDYIK